MRPSVWKALALLLVLLCFFGVLLGGYVYFQPNPSVVYLTVLSGAGYILVLDICFRVVVRWKTGRAYQMVPKLPFNEMYVEPHPYLTFVFRKKFSTQKSQQGNYPLNSDKGYIFGQTKINNLGYVDGQDGGRDTIVPKPDGLFRVLCLGASTTHNRIEHNGVVHSYPMHLESLLKSQFPEKAIEVINGGVGGYTTAEILIAFLLKLFEVQPDVIVIYHGYNDLGPSLTPDFQSDYSHARKNLGESYYKFRMSGYVPYVPVGIINYFTNVFFPQNLRYTLIPSISRGNANIKGDFKGLPTYERNIDHIVNICKSNGICVVLSTFCHHLYEGIRRDPVHLKYREGVFQENEVMRRLAEKHSLPLVENDRLVPSEDKYFVDSIHFSPDGMKTIAENFSKPIIAHISELNSRP